VEYVVWIALALQAGAFAVLARRLTRQARRVEESGTALDRERARHEELSRREARLVEMYGGVEELMDAFEGYLEEVRRELEAERASPRAATPPISPPEAPAEVPAVSVTAETPPDVLPEALPKAPAEVSAKAPAKAPSKASAKVPPKAPSKAAAETLPEVLPAEAGPPQPPPPPEAPERGLSGPDREELARCGAKHQKVRFLLRRGFSEDEAARELGIGKGEARLIAALDRP
jgi:hypothetical protein